MGYQFSLPMVLRSLGSRAKAPLLELKILYFQAYPHVL